MLTSLVIFFLPFFNMPNFYKIIELQIQISIEARLFY